jgi:hypothetical protein
MRSISQFFVSKQTTCLTSTYMSYLNRDLFLAYFCLILSHKILDLTSNIQNLIFFKKVSVSSSVQEKDISISSFVSNISC